MTEAKAADVKVDESEFEIRLHPDDEKEDIFRPRVVESCIPVERKYAKIWANYQKQLKRFWTPAKIVFKDDVKAWQSTPEGVRRALMTVLGYFAGSDDIVSANIGERTAREVKAPWVKRALNFQNMMEGIHSDTYNTNIEQIIPDNETREKLFNAINTLPSVKKKALWAKKWIRGYYPFRIRCGAWCAVEGIHFSASFAFIDWLKSRGYKFTGLFDGNAEISVDENQHTDLTIEIHDVLERRISREELKVVFDEALDAEKTFVYDFIPEDGFPGLTRSAMYNHVLHCANLLAGDLGYPNLYGHTSTPFAFATLRSLRDKSNFHERESVHYGKAGIGHSEEERIFKIEENF